MLPISLQTSNLKILLCGYGEKLTIRKQQLERINADFDWEEGIPSDIDEKNYRILMIAGSSLEESRDIINIAREKRILCNCEDIRVLCDFYFMSEVRRGDLCISISTNGKSPALARAIREYLDWRLDENWGQRLDDLAALRKKWRTEGNNSAEIMKLAEDHIYNNSWLPKK